MNSKFLLISFLSLILICCQKDSNQPVIQAELQPYFDIFQEEGIKRGVNVDFDIRKIEARIANLLDSNVNGWCSLNEDRPHEIIIDNDFWSEANEFEKEFIIMHELGHCYLERNHDDSIDDNGVCNSIMHSTSETCIFPYDGESRDDYLDELFK